jgi:hypothetical protein
MKKAKLAKISGFMLNRCPVSKENEKERFLSGRRMVQML